MLAPRKIHIAGDDHVWRCPHSPAEINRDKVVPNAAERSERDNLLYLWYTTLLDYRQRKLTVPSDRLPAISAIAKELQATLEFTYRAGIWLEDATRGLLWTTNGKGVRPVKRHAPSWSWASLESQLHSRPAVVVGPPPSFNMYPGGLIKIMGDSYTGVVSEPTMVLHVEAGTLSHTQWSGGTRILNDGSYEYYDLRRQTRTFEDAPWFAYIADEAHDQVLVEFDCPSEHDRYTLSDLDNVLLLRVSTWIHCYQRTRTYLTQALMLKAVDSDRDDTFERVGIAVIPYKYREKKVAWEVKQLHLV